MTGQYGKNHLGDLDEHMPTHHGFDEFFGNLYHLNAEEEPENPDYPQDPTFKEKFGPRGVIKSIANPDGTQTIEDTGPLTKQRMETVNVEVTRARSTSSSGRTPRTSRSSCGGTPLGCTSGPTSSPVPGRHRHRHLSRGMVEHDGMVGHLLDKLDELGIADNEAFPNVGHGPCGSPRSSCDRGRAALSATSPRRCVPPPAPAVRTRLYPVQVAVDVELEQDRGMIGWPTCRLGRDTVEPELPQVDRIHRKRRPPGRDCPRRSSHPGARETGRLAAICTFNKTPHPLPRSRRGILPSGGVFTQPGSGGAYRPPGPCLLLGVKQPKPRESGRTRL